MIDPEIEATMTKAEYLKIQEQVFQLVEQRDAARERAQVVLSQIDRINEALEALFAKAPTVNFRRKDGIFVPLFVEVGPNQRKDG